MGQQLDAKQEQQMIAQAHQHPEAFRELYRAYFPRVYAYISYRVVREQDVEDIVSEVFLRAINRFPQFENRNPGAFAVWLFRIAHNLVQSFYRRKRPLDDQLQLEALLNLQDSMPSNTALLQREQFIYFRRLISTLPPHQQEVITLRFFGRLLTREIADILGLDEASVASYLCRGIEDLYQKYLNDSIWESQGKSDERAR